MGAPGMTLGMDGGNRLYAGSFWHQVREKSELWIDQSKINLMAKCVILGNDLLCEIYLLLPFSEEERDNHIAINVRTLK
jgi:hypothetical protein